MKLHNLFKLFAPAALLMSLSTMPASAGLITGSLALSGNTVTETGADLLASISVSALSTLTSGPGGGDYFPIPNLTSFSGSTLTFATIATGGGFSFSNATFGTFTATSGIFTTPRTSTNADVFLLGTFTPAAGLTGVGICGGTACVVTGTLAHVSINLTGSGTSTSVAEAITLASPATSLPGGAPEPATMVLLGSALVGLGLFGSKRFAR